MLKKSRKVNWGLVQLVAVMFLLLVYAAIDGSTENGTSGKRVNAKKADVSGKSQTKLQLFNKQ